MKSYCPSCGSPLDPSADACTNCGEPVQNHDVAAEEAIPAVHQAAPTPSPKRSPLPYYMVGLGVLALTWLIFEISNPTEVKGPPQGNTAQNGMPPGHPPTSGEDSEIPPEQKAEMERIKKEMTAKADEIRKQLDADPANDSLRVQLANYYYDLSRYQEALTLYRDYLERHPNDADVRTDMAYCMANLMDVDGAMTELRKAIDSAPRHQNAPYLMAMMYMYKQNRDSSIHWMQRVLDIDSTTQQGRNASIFLKEMAEAHTSGTDTDRQ